MSADSEGLPALPFGFCRDHGVLLIAEESGPVLLCRARPRLEVLSEVRRFLGAPLGLRSIPDAEFQDALTRRFQRDSSEAVQVAEDLGSDHGVTSVGLLSDLRVGDRRPEARPA